MASPWLRALDAIATHAPLCALRRLVDRLVRVAERHNHQAAANAAAPLIPEQRTPREPFRHLPIDSPEWAEHVSELIAAEEAGPLTDEALESLIDGWMR